MKEAGVVIGRYLLDLRTFLHLFVDNYNHISAFAAMKLSTNHTHQQVRNIKTLPQRPSSPY